MMPRCGDVTGRTNKKGDPCRVPLIGGKCPTHDCDLSKRNAKVRQSYRERDPEGFARHQAEAGELGAAAAISKYGPEWFVRMMAAKAKDNPSGPEKKFLLFLQAHRINGFSFQEVVQDEQGTFYILDFYWSAEGVLIELDGWRHAKHAWGLPEMTMAKYRARLKAKVAYMESIGTKVLVLKWKQGKAFQEALEIQALSFLQANLNGGTHGQVECPF